MLKKFKYSPSAKGMAAIIQTVALIVLISSVILSVIAGFQGIPTEKGGQEKYKNKIYDDYCKENEEEVVQYYQNKLENSNQYSLNNFYFRYEDERKDTEKDFEEKYNENDENSYYYSFDTNYNSVTGQLEVANTIYSNYEQDGGVEPNIKYDYKRAVNGKMSAPVYKMNCIIEIDLKSEYNKLLKNIADRSAFREFSEYAPEYKYSEIEDAGYIEEYSDIYSEIKKKNTRDTSYSSYLIEKYDLLNKLQVNLLDNTSISQNNKTEEPTEEKNEKNKVASEGKVSEEATTAYQETVLEETTALQETDEENNFTYYEDMEKPFDVYSLVSDYSCGDDYDEEGNSVCVERWYTEEDGSETIESYESTYLVGTYEDIKTETDAKKEFSFDDMKIRAIADYDKCGLYVSVREAMLPYIDLLEQKNIKDYISEHNKFDSEKINYFTVELSEGIDKNHLELFINVYEIREVDYTLTSYIKEGAGEDIKELSAVFSFAAIAVHLDEMIIISAILFILSTLFLIYSAGHTEGREGIYINRLSRFPLDVFTFIMICIFLIEFAAIYDEFFSYNVYDYSYAFQRIENIMIWKSDIFIYALVAAEFIIIIDAILLSAYGYSLVTNLKAGNVIKGSLFTKVFRKIKSFAGMLLDNVAFSVKVLLGFAVIALIEGKILIDCIDYYYAEETVIVFVIFRVIEAIIIIYFMSQLVFINEKAEAIAEGRKFTKKSSVRLRGIFKKHSENLDSIDKGIQVAVEEQVKSQRMKAELITNVSHDIKTPVTSIINYVDLLKKEDIQNETAKGYIDVLDRQSGRLKKLIQDLLDASKASTGNLEINMEKINLGVLLEQIEGENEERLSGRGLCIVSNMEDCSHEETAFYVNADGRYLYRAIDNLIQNVIKYAAENSRVYIDIEDENEYISLVIKNISKEQLNISGDELTERFVRGDKSRNTEGSGLGLSIAKSLMELQEGGLEIIIDGDLFKAVINIKKYIQEKQDVTEEDSE